MMEKGQWGWSAGCEGRRETGQRWGLGAGCVCPGSLAQAGPPGAA